MLIDNEIISYNANDKTNNRQLIIDEKNFTSSSDHTTDIIVDLNENVDLSNNDAALYVYGGINNSILHQLMVIYQHMI